MVSTVHPFPHVCQRLCGDLSCHPARSGFENVALDRSISLSIQTHGKHGFHLSCSLVYYGCAFDGDIVYHDCPFLSFITALHSKFYLVWKKIFQSTFLRHSMSLWIGRKSYTLPIAKIFAAEATPSASGKKAIQNSRFSPERTTFSSYGSEPKHFW